MTDKDQNVVPFRAKNFSRISDDPRIEVLHVAKVSRKIEPYSFCASMIDHLEGTGADKSTIVLKSGVVLTLSLPYADLAEKIDEGTSPLDLKEYCVTTFLPEAGDQMEDGTILAGISPDTGKAMYVTAEDAPITMDFNKAAQYASRLGLHGHKGWRLPTKSELAVLFQNQNKGALSGTFNRAGETPDGLYRSSTPKGAAGSGVWMQRFSDGNQTDYDSKTRESSIRCVRD